MKDFLYFSEFMEAVRKVLDNNKFRSISRDGLQSTKPTSTNNVTSNKYRVQTLYRSVGAQLR